MEVGRVVLSRIDPGKYAVGASAAMLAVIIGVLANGLTAFVVPMEQAEGWTRASITGINSAGLVGLAVGSVVMPLLARNWTMRSIAMVSAVTTGFCLILSSQATAPWLLYALFFVAGALGSGTVFAPIFVYVGSWFPRAAGLAIGITAAGQALGQGGVPFVAAWLIEAGGWRQAMLVLGLFACLLVPLGAFLRQPPAASAAASMPEPPIAGEVAVPLLALAVFLCCTCMAVPLMHAMPLMIGCGIAPIDAGSVMLVMLVAAIAGRIAYGKLCDLIDAKLSWLLASALQTVGVLAFLHFESLGGFLVFGIVYGFAYAGVMTSLLVATRVLTPVENKALWMGVVISVAWLGHAFGGFQAALSFDIADAYGPGFVIGALAGVGNLLTVGLLLWLARPPARPPALA
ncbi:MFS transporter [Reyranella sp.]|uniref:MFS transporter n=1 Tax=Reyranella sp. TaxID=1929291 RepID=UPI003BA9C0F5